MAIYRTQHNKENPYVMLNRHFFENPGLSAKAKGILGYLLSRPDGWVAQTEQIASVMKDGLCSIRSGLAELEKAGYFKRSPVRDSGTGKITHWIKDVFEEPQALLSPHSGNQHIGNLLVENPQCGKPSDGNSTLLINELETNELGINDQINIPPTPLGGMNNRDELISSQKEEHQERMVEGLNQNPPLSLEKEESLGQAVNSILGVKDSAAQLPGERKTANKSAENYDKFLQAYLTEKPSNFVNHEKLSETHLKTIKRLQKAYKERSLEIFTAALIYCREQHDSWWRNSTFSLANLGTNGKIEDYADKHFDLLARDRSYSDRVKGLTMSNDVARQSTFTRPATPETSATASNPPQSPFADKSVFAREREALKAVAAKRAKERDEAIAAKPKSKSPAEMEEEFRKLLEQERQDARNRLHS